MNTYQSYPKHNDALTKASRAYNRAMTMHNILEDLNDEEAEFYAEQFTDRERLDMAMIIKAISVQGREAVSKQIAKQLEEVTR